MTRTCAYAYCALMTLIFSAHYLVARVILQTVTPLALGAGRGLVGGLVLALIFRRSLAAAVKKGLPPVLLLIAPLRFGLNQILLFQGTSSTWPPFAA